MTAAKKATSKKASAKKAAAKKVVKKAGENVGYCVKCKGKREMTNPKKVTFKNGRKAMQGLCPECGTKMTRILPG
jgi:hypothetical protein